MTLDYNHRPSFAEQVNAAVDRALTADQATRPPRGYLGGSRLGHACERALQFEFTATPKDEGHDFGLTRYRASALMTFGFNKRAIRQLIDTAARPERRAA